MVPRRRLILYSTRLLHTSRYASQSAGKLSVPSLKFPSGIESQKKVPLVPLCQHARTFVTSRPRQITGQEAPSAQAYISSGVVGGNENPIGVKKVIMIGSGGLSIGQAGEFDYSGMCYMFGRMRSNCTADFYFHIQAHRRLRLSKKPRSPPS